MTEAIKVVYENHWNFGIHVADTLSLIRCGLELAGYRADIEKSVVPGAINILIENFSDEFTEKMSLLANQGTRFIIVATEFLTGDTFNDFNKLDAPSLDKHYDNLAYWRGRHRNFMRLAERATAVWHLSEHQVNEYRKHLDCPVAYLPHGYVPMLRRITMRPDEERDIDFLFTGTLTPYRRPILETLSKKGFRVYAEPMLTAHFHREDLVSRTKIALDLRQHEGWLHPSNNRIHYHLNNASLILSERRKVGCDLDNYIEHGEPLVEAAIASLQKGSYTERGNSALARFAAESAMGPRMKLVLNQSLESEYVK